MIQIPVCPSIYLAPTSAHGEQYKNSPPVIEQILQVEHSFSLIINFIISNETLYPFQSFQMIPFPAELLLAFPNGCAYIQRLCQPGPLTNVEQFHNQLSLSLSLVENLCLLWIAKEFPAFPLYPPTLS